MTQDALLSARRDLTQAQAFRTDLPQDLDDASAEDRLRLRKMTSAALDEADRHRSSMLAGASREQASASADKAAELRRDNERRLPESLRDEPTLAVRIRKAALDRDFRFNATLDIGRTMRFNKAVAAGMRREELRLVVGTDDKGGYFVPDVWEQAVSSGFRRIEGVSEVVNPIMTDHGRDIFINTRSVASAGASALTASSTIGTYLVAEGGSYRTDTEPTYGQAVLTAYKALQAQAVSTELLEDASVNVADEVGRAVGQWFGEYIELCYTNGTGTNEPKGVFDGIPTTNEVDTAASGTLTIADLATLIRQTPGNRNGYSFIANPGSISGCYRRTIKSRLRKRIV